MDFLDPKKRRAHVRRLYVGYALMAVLIFGLASLLVLQSFGYSFNPRTGDITQNGLVFVDAHPESADVIINGQSKGFTDQRLVMPAGKYSLELKREGYHDWRRDFVLEGGHIERFVYPFLFPTNLQTAQEQLYKSQPAFATQSPDRRWLLVRQPGSIREFDKFDLNTETAVATNLTLPESLLTATGNKHNFELVEWSTDNRRVLIKHTYDGGSEFVLIDHESPAASLNVNKVFTGKFTRVTLRDKKFDKYYFYDEASKRLLTGNLDSRSFTLILNNVLEFTSHGNDVLFYITPDSADKNKVVAKVLEDGETYTLRELPTSSKYLLDVAQFEDKWYMVVGSNKEGRIYIYRDPVALTKRGSRLVPVALLKVDDPKYVSFSHNARVIAVQSAGHFGVYDAETDRIYRYDTELDVEASQKASWMDGHRLTLVHDGKVSVFDFDGNNKQTLSASYKQFIPFFDRDYTAMHTLAPSPEVTDRAALLRTELIVE